MRRGYSVPHERSSRSRSQTTCNSVLALQDAESRCQRLLVKQPSMETCALRHSALAFNMFKADEACYVNGAIRLATCVYIPRSMRMRTRSSAMRMLTCSSVRMRTQFFNNEFFPANAMDLMHHWQPCFRTVSAILIVLSTVVAEDAITHQQLSCSI